MNGSDMIELEEKGKTVEDLYDIEQPEPSDEDLENVDQLLADDTIFDLEEMQEVIQWMIDKEEANIVYDHAY